MRRALYWGMHAALAGTAVFLIVLGCIEVQSVLTMATGLERLGIAVLVLLSQWRGITLDRREASRAGVADLVGTRA